MTCWPIHAFCRVLHALSSLNGEVAQSNFAGAGPLPKVPRVISILMIIGPGIRLGKTIPASMQAWTVLVNSAELLQVAQPDFVIIGVCSGPLPKISNRSNSSSDADSVQM